MYQVTKYINDEIFYQTQVESLVNHKEHQWYATIHVVGMPSMRKINEIVSLNGKYLFAFGEGKDYSGFIEIKKLGE